MIKRDAIKKPAEKQVLLLADILAAVIGIALTLIMAYVARRTGVSGDDCFYFSIPQRLLQGDRMFVDEWHLSQLSSLFQILPYWLYVRINGSNDGIVLFMQYFYLAINLALYFFFYHRFKKVGKPFVGIAAAALFCSCPMVGFILPNYYNMGVQSIAFVGALLFVTSRDEIRRSTALLGGLALACAVLIQPGFVVIYVFYCIAVLLAERSKRCRPLLEPYRFILNRQSWLLITLGCVIAAAALCIYLQCTSGFGNIIRNLPGLLSAGDYDMTLSYRVPYYLFKIVSMIFGGGAPFLTILMDVLLVIAAVYPIAAKKRRLPSSLSEEGFKIVLFVLFALVALVHTISFYRQINPNLWNHLDASVRHELEDNMPAISILSGIPIMFFCLFCILLCKKRSPHFTAFYIIAVLASAGADYTSEVYICYAAIVAVFPLLYFITEFVRETVKPYLCSSKGKLSATASGAATQKKKKRAYSFILCLLVVLMAARLCFNSQQWIYPADLSAGSTQLMESGPYKGNILSSDQVRKYLKLQEDLQALKQKRGDRVCVFGCVPYISLYLDQPIGAYSTYIHADDSLYRFAEYWTLQPEDRPAYIVLPKVMVAAQPSEEMSDIAKKNIDRLAELCTFEQEEKDTCIILTVSQWHIPADKLEDMKSVLVIH